MSDTFWLGFTAGAFAMWFIEIAHDYALRRLQDKARRHG